MIILAGIERGLSYEAVQKMTIGQVVDFCVEYNQRQKKENVPKQKKATQTDIDAFFGGR